MGVEQFRLKPVGLENSYRVSPDKIYLLQTTNFKRHIYNITQHNYSIYQLLGYRKGIHDQKIPTRKHIKHTVHCIYAQNDLIGK